MIAVVIVARLKVAAQSALVMVREIDFYPRSVAVSYQIGHFERKSELQQVVRTNV